MEEGTFPNDPEIPTNNSQDLKESSAPIQTQELQKPNPSHPLHGGQGYGSSHFSKKLIKMGIGLFVIFTIILAFITFILPRLSTPTNKEVTLTYWGLSEDENVMKPVIAEFEKEHPNIKVNYIKQDPVDYNERVKVRSANGKGPDIFTFHNTWQPMISDLLLPIPEEYVSKSDFNSKYYDVAKKDLIKNGILYGIPLQTDTLALFINTQIFEDAAKESGQEISIPKTWQEFIDAATSLTKRDDSGGIEIAGAGIGTFDNVNHAPDIISLIMVQNGVDLSDLSNSTDRIADALRFYTNFSRNENSVWDSTQDSSELAFAQGKLAMYFGYSWDYFIIKAINPNLPMKVVPVPQLVSDDKINVASYWAEGVSSKSNHPKESLEFIKFLSKPETQEMLYGEEAKVRAFGEPYSNKNLLEKLNGTDAFVFADQSRTAVSSPFVSGTNDKGINEDSNNILRDAINAIISGDSEETVVDEFLKSYVEVIRKYTSAKVK